MALLSVKNKEMFHHEGHIYVFDKLTTDGQKKMWRCNEKNRGCKARLHSNAETGEVICTRGTHIHPSSMARVEVTRALTAMKTRAVSTQEGTSQIINNCVQNLSMAVQGQMPNQHALKKTIRRRRVQVQAPPPNPANLIDLVVPQDSVYRQYEPEPGDFENFLLAERAPSADNILIFGRESNLGMLERSQRWYIDGTFRMAPLVFAQVFVVLCEELGGVHPVAYGLLPNKRRITYDRFFQMLHNLRPNAAPASVSCDYELNAFRAVSERYPNAEIHGCFFHFVKNFKRCIRNNDLETLYNEDVNFALLSRMIPALAFVPPNTIEDSFMELSNFLPPELNPVLDWLEDYYIGRRVGNNNRRPPTFAVAMWNVHDRVQQHLGRTNNFAEAAHRRIMAELQCDHPTIWKLIADLKKVQKSRDLFYESLVAGHQPPRKRRRYIACDERIERIVGNFNGYPNVLDFLRGVAHNFEM